MSIIGFLHHIMPETAWLAQKPAPPAALIFLDRSASSILLPF
jgi:hypothetical protein